MLEVTGYLKLDLQLVGLRQTSYVMLMLLCQFLTSITWTKQI